MQHALDGQEAVSEIRLGRRARADAGACFAEEVELAEQMARGAAAKERLASQANLALPARMALQIDVDRGDFRGHGRVLRRGRAHYRTSVPPPRAMPGFSP